YLFEHLFLASIHFEGADEAFFRLVRSHTPPGSPVSEIATRRPFGDPKTTRPYYRFVLRDERPLDKTHMPYALGPERLSRFRGWFWDPSYEVTELPGYDSEDASNPFKVFAAIPQQVRYRFLLEEAQFFMMGFIKGPVCRGQAALNVIRDRFWVTFLRPDTPWIQEEGQALSQVSDDLALPAEHGSDASLTDWLGYSSRHSDYMKQRWAFFRRATKDGQQVTPELIWDGDGNNQNAALTVFRHFDSATVVKGLVGGRPRSTWVLGYPILERIHYLLVAGFDVFGSAGHQLATRLYMDFLRLEAESLFLSFLPPGRRVELGDYWYRGVTGSEKRAVAMALQGADVPPGIQYRTRTPERELLQLIQQRLEPVRAHDFELSRAAVEDRALLQSLDDQWGSHVAELPETSFLMVTGADGKRWHYSILRDSAHANVATLFDDDDIRKREEDELTVAPGFLGAYPNALFAIGRNDLPGFVAAVAKLRSPDDYRALRQRYGVLRSSPRFWAHADQLQADRDRLGGEARGLLDFNRLGGL
ncbi:MAG TPA: fatty acid cis/trans isomerase, partial [Polyangiaceae bacterium]